MWLKKMAPNGDVPPSDSVAVQMVVDDEALLEAMGNDPATVTAVVSTFLRALAAYEIELRASLESDQSALVREIAHKLKGALGNLRAPQATADATALENAARAGLGAELPALSHALLVSMAEVKKHFEHKHRAGP